MERARGRGARGAAGAFGVAYEDDICWLSTSRPASWCTRPRASHGNAGPGAGRPRRRGRGPVSRGDRAPAGSRYLRAARGGRSQTRSSARFSAAGGQTAAPRVRGAGGGAPAGPHRDDRRPDRPPPQVPRPHVDRHRRAAGGAHPFRDRAHAPAATLLRVVLDTGRTHQIRVHLAAIEHPVCGDPRYGTAGVYGLRRQFLHAARLAFTHPVTGEDIDVVPRCPRIWRRRWRGPRPARNKRRGGPSKAAPPTAGEPTTGGRGREVRFATVAAVVGGTTTRSLQRPPPKLA